MELVARRAPCGLQGRKEVGNFNVPAIHLLILTLYVLLL